MDENLRDNRRVFELLFQLGEAYLERKQYDEAIEKFQKLIEFGEENAAIYVRLSEAYLQKEQYDNNAIHTFQKALEFEPDNKIINNILSQIYLINKKEDDEAYQVYLKTLQGNPAHSKDLITALIKIDYKKGNHQTAKALAEESLEMYPEHYEIIPYFTFLGWQEKSFNEVNIVLKNIYQKGRNAFILKWFVLNYIKMIKNFSAENKKIQFEYDDIDLCNYFLKSIVQFNRLNEIYLFLAVKNIVQVSLNDNIIDEDQSIAEYELFLGENSFFNIWDRGLNKKFTISQSFDFSQEIWNRIIPMNNRSSNFSTTKLKSPEKLTDQDFLKFNTLMIIQIVNYDELILKGHYKDIILKFDSLLNKSFAENNMILSKRVNDGYIIFKNDTIRTINESIQIFKASSEILGRHSENSPKFQMIIHHRASEHINKLLDDLNVLFEVQKLFDNTLSGQNSSNIFNSNDHQNKIYITESVFNLLKYEHRHSCILYENIRLLTSMKTIPIYDMRWEDPLDKIRNGSIQRIDRFQILGEIYLNDAFNSFKAVDTFLDRLVILKILRPDFPTSDHETLSTLFLEKANIIGRLNHNNIAIIYDINEDEGFCYIAREFVEGTQLSEMLVETHTINWQNAVEICRQIGDGLSYAHKLGILHGRLKPNNIFLSEMNEIKITDFSIPGFTTPIKEYNNLNLKNISYISPEQLGNNSADQRSDLYSLGIILYELITNKNPFYDNDKKVVFDKIKNFFPPPVSSFNSNIPIEADEIISKALAKSPGDRFDSIDQFMNRLYNLLK